MNSNSKVAQARLTDAKKRNEINELEQERYKLIEKVKSLELAKAAVESDSARKDEKLKELFTKCNQFHSKLMEYKERNKEEQKEICNLFRKVGDIFKNISAWDKFYLEFITKIFHGLAFKKPVDFNELELFDHKAAFSSLFDDEAKKKFSKIDLGKLEDSILKGFSKKCDIAESRQFFGSSYNKIVSWLEKTDESRQALDLSVICNEFETQKKLIQENSELLRHNTNRSFANHLDESAHYRSNSFYEDGRSSFRSSVVLPDNDKLYRSTLLEESSIFDSRMDFGGRLSVRGRDDQNDYESVNPYHDPDLEKKAEEQ